VALLHTYLSADPPCLEYEYVGGGDLAGMLQQWAKEKPEPARATRLILDIARVVGFAHQLSPPIVHRDLKPANILLSPNSDGTFSARVADFGIGAVAAGREIARSVRGVSQGAFLMTALRGAHTPMYASPQQMAGKDADPRDDVFALGVIWYQMLGAGLMGGRPGGTRWTGKLTAAGVPATQVELLSSCLEDDPADRPKDAQALAEALALLVEPAVERKKEPAAPRPAPAIGKPDEASLKEKIEALWVGDLCPECAQPMRVKANKLGGYFLGCTAFPTCRGTRRLPPEIEARIKELKEGKPAPAPAPAKRPGLVVALEEITNTLGMRFVLVPAGSFLMGSPAGEAMRAEDEGPVRAVAIAEPFYLGVHPVTQAQYEKVMGKNPAHFTKKEGGGPDHPVECVSGLDSEEFCRKLSAKDGKKYRLPTEAEWEYACRAGTLSAFAFGDSLSSSEANFDGTRPYGGGKVGPFLERTSQVGAFKPNAWGLFDMHGNVWEWCADAAPDKQRMVRGGSGNNSGHLCRSARRQRYAPSHRGETVGFRVALALG
ncbi:MAG: SUMF1/EgtB/PvdO family nonheme iron enzyme, partial [Gemmataceae bacterium]|nr:SUMF1/EgtB/PvdO family nonheme iron enzyme [Gemmataceae bacterium]